MSRLGALLGRRLRRGAVAVIAATALGWAGLVGAAAPAQAAACSSTDSGVTVVVTFPGGSTSVRCAGGDPDSGASALQGAGFSITQVQTQPGFICRIDGAPASDACVRTPPTSAYWSYWTAQPGGSWSYISTGAFSRNPAPGSVEGWSFGAGAPPAVAPPRIEAPAPPPPSTTPAPRPTTSAPAPAPSTKAPAPRPSATAPAPRTTTSRPASSGGGSQGTPAATSTGGSEAGSAAAATAGGSESATGSATASATEAATSSASETASETAEATATETAEGAATTGAPTAETVAAGTSESGTGTSVGTLTGLGVAALLLGTAGWMGWRRRTAP